MRSIKYFMFLSLMFLSACSTLILKPADFSWPVEAVVNVANNGNVDVQRYSLSFNAKELFFNETGDSLGYENKQLRIIRNENGYYFITDNNFKNVYVFKADKGSLSLEKKIGIIESKGENTKLPGMIDPAFNQRSPFIELVYGNGGNIKVNLTEEGIIKEEKK
jgi:hypothetical protein